MDFDSVRNYCLVKKGVTESFPFDEETPVYKVMSKIFLIGSVDYPPTINLKCNPELAVDLRERFPGVTPGYHMNKTHWNTIDLSSGIPPKKIYEWIDHSYELVSLGLKKQEKLELEKL